MAVQVKPSVAALTLVALALTSSCGGSGSGSFPSRVATTPGVNIRGRGTVQLTIKVPARASGNTKHGIRPQYVSPATQSLTIAIDNAPPVAYNVTTSSSNCAAGSGSVAFICTLGMAVSAGNHTVAIVTYDQSNATGNVLSQNTVTVAVSPGQVDNIPIILNGVVASIALALASSQVPLGVPTTVGLGVNGYDADQNLIIGPGIYQSNVTITDSDTSGATSLAVTDNGSSANEGTSAVVSDSTAVVTVVYTGTPTTTTGASLSATASTIQSSGGATSALSFVPTINHIIIIIQENRTVDNLFNGFPGANTVQSGLTSAGQTVELQPENLAEQWDPNHSHNAFLTEFDNGQMDGFNKEEVGCSPCSPAPPTDPVYAYVPQAQVQPYWTLAQNFALADDMFESNEGPSVPAHMYLSFGSSAVDNTNTLYAMDNPTTPAGAQTSGCDSPAETLEQLINPATNDQSQFMYPCFDHQTLWDLLDAAGVTWRWYQPQLTNGLWYTPDAIKHIRYGPDYANVSTPNTNILTDIANGNLPGVSWVIPTAAESDHAASTDGSGPAWVASVVNAVGNSSYWNETAIFIVWDDWGGWYDHVVPPQYNYFELGFRVPLIAVSPYTVSGYVSHNQHEFGSILHYTEERFGLGNLGTTDVRADDLSDMFNYSQLPIVFSTIPAPAVSRKSARDRRIPDKD
jgi:phospholipase C